MLAVCLIKYYFKEQIIMLFSWFYLYERTMLRIYMETRRRTEILQCWRTKFACSFFFLVQTPNFPVHYSNVAQWVLADRSMCDAGPRLMNGLYHLSMTNYISSCVHARHCANSDFPSLTYLSHVCTSIDYKNLTTRYLHACVQCIRILLANMYNIYSLTYQEGKSTSYS